MRMSKNRTLKELVKYEGAASLLYCQNEYMMYEVDGFKFPVPFADMGDGMFSYRMKPITMMRWIRKQLELLAKHEDESI